MPPKAHFTKELRPIRTSIRIKRNMATAQSNRIVSNNRQSRHGDEGDLLIRRDTQALQQARQKNYKEIETLKTEKLLPAMRRRAQFPKGTIRRVLAGMKANARLARFKKSTRMK